MTTKAQAPSQYRVTGGHWRMVQVLPPERMAAQRAHFHGGDILPPWVDPDHLQHLLELGLVEKVEPAR